MIGLSFRELAAMPQAGFLAFCGMAAARPGDKPWRILLPASGPQIRRWKEGGDSGGFTPEAVPKPVKFWNQLALFVPKGFNAQEPACRFAGELQGEVVDCGAVFGAEIFQQEFQIFVFGSGNNRQRILLSQIM
jgi:hypothetical protein